MRTPSNKKAKGDPSKGLPKAPNGSTSVDVTKTNESSEPVTKKPTHLEIAQLAASLSLSAQNHGKSEFEMAQMATRYWEAAAAVPLAATEERVIIATASKMRDDDNLFAIPRTSNKKRISAPLITPRLWIRRVAGFPGSKYDLFLHLLSEVAPRETLLKELFPDTDVARETQLRELLLFPAKGEAIRFVYRLAEELADGLPPLERNSLLAAIETLDMGKGLVWMRAADGRCPGAILGFASLLIDLISIKERAELLPGSTVCAILCRWLVHARQSQISHIRSKAGRKRGEDQPPNLPVE